jgi:hypothetical protein
MQGGWVALEPIWTYLCNGGRLPAGSNAKAKEMLELRMQVEKQ